LDVRELEWQFDAVDLRPVLRWLTERGPADAGPVRVDPQGNASQVDIYLDTDDRRFHRAGYALRIRRTGRATAAEATLKQIASAMTAQSGLRSRREVSERLEQADLALLAQSNGPVGLRVRAVAGRKKVRTLFEVRTRRRVLSVEANGFPPGEIALDNTAIRAAGHGTPTRLQRVEIEVPEQALPALQPFVDGLRSACRLQPAGVTKYEAGVLSAGLEAVPDGFGSTAIEPDAPIGRVGLAVLRRHFAVLLAKEPGSRLGDDIEELHDMRVATRRLRAALSLFAEFLPPSAGQLGDELKWVGQTLGAVRDLDVQFEELERWHAEIPETDRDALVAIRLLLEAQRADAREAMLEALDSRRYELLVARFGRMLRSARGRRSGPASLPARDVAPDMIEERFRAFRKAGAGIATDSPAAAYHRLRIRCKRLRYGVEFLSDVYPGRTRRFIKHVVALQDLLGLHQDVAVGIDRLRGLVVERGAELPPETIFVLGEIAERYRRLAEELRGDFPDAYARVIGKRWKSFAKVIEAERPSPAAPGSAGPPAASET
jgi:triphosphatase